MPKSVKKKVKVKVEKPLKIQADYKQPLQFNIEKEIIPDKIKPKDIFELMNADIKIKTKTKTKSKY
tara:strand:- start:5766 stop:5963 length:198 start_codon:yes stop_codon:yes gene_type:complete